MPIIKELALKDGPRRDPYVTMALPPRLGISQFADTGCRFVCQICIARFCIRYLASIATMCANTISTFGESDELCAALAEAGYRQLLVIEPGAFRARMTRITLDHVRLSFIEEQLARIASITLAPGAIRILLPPL